MILLGGLLELLEHGGIGLLHSEPMPCMQGVEVACLRVLLRMGARPVERAPEIALARELDDMAHQCRTPYIGIVLRLET